MTVRNLLFGSIVTELRKTYKIRFLSYYSDQLAPLYTDSLGETTFQEIRQPRWSLPQLRGFFSTVLTGWEYHALWQEHHPLSQKRFVERQKNTKFIKYCFDVIGGRLTNIVRRNRGTDIFRDLAYGMPVRRQFSEIQAVLLASTDLPKDKALAYSLKKAGIPTVVLVHSWDVLPSRGLMAAQPDRLLVWSQSMAEQAIRLHNIKRETIDVVGGPQYEHYRLVARKTSKRRFHRRLGLPESAPIVTYTCNVKQVFPDEPRFLSELVGFFERGSLGNAHLIIRLHPTDPIRSRKYMNQYHEKNARVTIDIADDNFAAENTGQVGSPSAIKYFVELMQYSDVVINVGSTVTLDAIVHDTPVICPKIQFSAPENSWDEIDLRYKNNHTLMVAESGAVSLPTSMDECLGEIRTALQFPENRKIEREQLVNQLVPDLPTSYLINESLRKVL